MEQHSNRPTVTAFADPKKKRSLLQKVGAKVGLKRLQDRFDNKKLYSAMLMVQYTKGKRTSFLTVHDTRRAHVVQMVEGSKT